MVENFDVSATVYTGWFTAQFQDADYQPIADGFPADHAGRLSFYSRDASFQILRANTRFVPATAAGSIVGSVAGWLLLGVAPCAALIPILKELL